MMYSLYRAWLMRDAAYTSSIISQPPDIVIQVGSSSSIGACDGTNFTAHRNILAAHSGYFKSIISSNLNNPTQEDVLSTPIIIPNIGVAEFTALLTYMYTGYLDLTMENIYNILLATHILHMPSALEVCRNFLIQNNHLLHLAALHHSVAANPALIPLPNVPTVNDENHFSDNSNFSARKLPPTIVKPIPVFPEFNKTAMPLPITNQIEDKTTNQNLQQINNKVINTQLNLNNFQEQKSLSPKPSTSHEFYKKTNHHRKETINLESLNQNIIKSYSKKPSSMPQLKTNFKQAFETIPTQDKPRQLSPTPSDSSTNSSDDKIVHLKIKKNVLKRAKPILFDNNNNNNKVIVDIACCDGPVRFHRVLNKFYGENVTNLQNENEINDQPINRNELMNKIMTENIREMENEENKKRLEESKDTENDTIYTCIYCNHTFKSQYCYQKHTKRHINPMSINASTSTQPINNSPSSHSSIASCSSKEIKREVKLLDMNVQYYPCKTCGCKFPSYYFVHKHRKMYHADEENFVNDEQKENEIENVVNVIDESLDSKNIKTNAPVDQSIDLN